VINIWKFSIKNDNSTICLSFQLFTEYGRLALEANDNESKPFQVKDKLII